MSPDTIRLYESMGLLRATRSRNGYRDFPEEAQTIVALIRQAQRLGFSLGEIGAVLRGLSGELSAAEVEALLTRKLADIDRQLADLQSLRGLLEVRLRDVCALGLDTARGMPAARAKATGPLAARTAPRQRSPARPGNAGHRRATAGKAPRDATDASAVAPARRRPRS